MLIRCIDAIYCLEVLILIFPFSQIISDLEISIKVDMMQRYEDFFNDNIIQKMIALGRPKRMVTYVPPCWAV